MAIANSVSVHGSFLAPGEDGIGVLANTTGNPTLTPDSLGVATNSLFLTEWHECTQLLVMNSSKAHLRPGVKVWGWDELDGWGRLRDTLLASGLDPEASDPWQAVGLCRENVPSIDVLEARRRAFNTLLSATAIKGWAAQDVAQGMAASVKMEAAFSACQTELPEILKKIKKKKAGGTLVPHWQEPSTILLEWALGQNDKLTLALHLSNLQKVALERWQISPENSTTPPRILTIEATRALYTALSQGPAKIEEALSNFSGGGLMLWVPEGGEQLPRILAAMTKLYEKGVILDIHFLIPFSPFPACATPESILDLWGHAALQPKYHNMIGGITFLREASKCVFTRDNNPIYATKNVVSIQLRMNAGGAVPQMVNAVSAEDLIHEPFQGECIYVDTPVDQVAITRQVLHTISSSNPHFPQVWKQGYRSRGFTRDLPRETIVGPVPNSVDLETQAIVKGIISFFQNNESAKTIDALIGRQGLFGNRNAILFEGTASQLQRVRASLGECIFVSPHKALCIPCVDADVLIQALTAEECLHTAVLRFRKSGPMKGQIFAKARAIQEHVQASRRMAFAARQPQPTSSMLQRQVQIEVLNLDAINYEHLPAQIMKRVSELLGPNLQETNDYDTDLAAGEWKVLRRDGHWNGRILVQCSDNLDLAKFFRTVNGRNICMDGICKTLAVTSPTVDSLAAQVFSAQANRQLNL